MMLLDKANMLYFSYRPGINRQIKMSNGRVQAVSILYVFHRFKYMNNLCSHFLLFSLIFSL